MKKNIFRFLVLSLTAVLTFGSVANVSAETSEDVDPAITLSYLELYGEQLKQEILAEIAENGISGGSDYRDVSAKQGQIIYLSSGTEVIYRGGGAVAITCGNNSGDGVLDLSEGTELFSGNSLEYGHIYYPSGTDSVKAILITGETAVFTLRGEYEIG